MRWRGKDSVRRRKNMPHIARGRAINVESKITYWISRAHFHLASRATGCISTNITKRMFTSTSRP
ncbi:hypothetical protein DPMN_038258 [Dreissena polymorpha]|uniref:Uncharacterized protein n=1 Tax=Dreissena polymorpha TaxID=45954 RepID=A0A9D4MCS3_DREPO|nr:hypothetical protein DPMN_038258 [Dreissena polymorpha]